MRIIVVGASGTLGQAVTAELTARHEVIQAGRSSGDVRVDISDPASIRAMYEQTGRVDAVVSTAGNVHFAPLADMGPQEYQLGLADKLMGQVSLVLIGREYVSDGASFTLTSGILGHDPIVAGSSASMVNAGLEGFARAAAVELPRGLRVNVVSPTLVDESAEALGAFFPGFVTVPAARVAKAYRKSVEGPYTGRVLEVLV